VKRFKDVNLRAQWWDYRNAAAYFITICTQNRQHYFGEIQDQKMQLSTIGAIADVLWFELPHRNPTIELGEYVIMPDHMHGILILKDSVGSLRATNQQETTNQQLEKNQKMAAISPKANSVSAIIRSYKSAVTKHLNRLDLEFKWQSRFYDHIIRDEAAFERISNYIKANPENWEKKEDERDN
tara:strand:- start:87 stop:635 length:549 start_codon:yes stop_codon:yes gene_type:complete